MANVIISEQAGILALTEALGWADPRSFGAIGDGAADDTSAFQDAVDYAIANKVPLLCPQTYLLTSTITFVKSDTNMLVVDGCGTGIFDFEPTANDIMFDVSNGATEMFCFHFKGFRVTSDDTTYKKTAILVSDISTSKFENIIIGAEDKWTGASSVGIQTKGRELTSFENIRIHADIPIQLSKNPNNTTYQTDNFHFKDLTLVCLNNTMSNILVDDGVTMINLIFDGYQSWHGGLNGFYYNNTEATGISSGYITIKNVRWEQTSPSGNGYMITVTDNSANSYLIDHLVFENCYVVGDTDTPSNYSAGGMNLKEISNVAILNCSALTNFAGSVMLNFNACLNIRVTNFGTPGATWPTLTNMSTIKEIRSYNGYSIVDAIYDYSLPLGTVTTIIPSYIQGAGTPVGSQTPDFIGQEYMDTATGDWYKSYSTGNTHWGKLTN